MSSRDAARPSVDFYILSTNGSAQRLHFACRLTEKAWKQGHRVFLNADDARMAEELDRMLWTFREDSFVPHCRLGSEDPELDKVLIGAGEPGAAPVDVMVNLAEAAPAFALSSNRVAELVSGDDAGRAAGRARFRYYREHGCEIRTHEV